MRSCMLYDLEIVLLQILGAKHLEIVVSKRTICSGWLGQNIWFSKLSGMEGASTPAAYKFDCWIIKL